MFMKIDLTGQKFGRLTALEDVGRNKQRTRLWLCQCECGNSVVIPSTKLRCGHTKSCGCLSVDTASNLSYQNIVGQKFGRLVVLEDVGRQNGGVLWLCLCECGKKIKVQAGSLKNGHTQSCGCFNKQRLSETHKGSNNSNWKGGVTSLNETVRKCIQYREWRKLVFERDHYTCQHCQTRGGKLIAHHIKFFSVIMNEHNIQTLEEAEACKELWDTNNGLTLCRKCHREEHKRK